MYLIGIFEIIGILTSDGELFRKELGREAYRNNAHFKYFDENPDDESWIFKGSGKSFLFPVGVPIRRTDLTGLYNIELSKTKQTETGQVSSYTRSAREIKNLRYLEHTLGKRGISLPNRL